MTQRYRGPLDLLGIYLTPSESGLGQRLNLDTIDKELRRMPLRPVLRLLALTAFRADRSISEKRERVDLARALLPPGPPAERAVELIDHGAFLVGSQHALALAVRALVHCPERTGVPVGDLPRRLGKLLVALGDHLGAGKGQRTEELCLELVRLGLHYRLNGIFDWYATAEELFFDVIPSMTDDHEHIDVAGVIENKLGISISDYWGISAAIGIVVMSGEKLQTFPTSIAGLPDETMGQWSAALTQSVDEARDRARSDIASGSGWALGAFFSKPILAELAEDGDYVMRPQLLALKATLTGMYHLVFDLLRDRGGAQHLQWSRFFGRAVERYGRSRLTEALPAEVELSFPDDRPASPDQPKACDALIAEGDALIAADFVHRILNVATQTTGTPAALAHDLLVAIVEKAEQMDVTLAQTATHHVDRLFPVVVMSGPLPMTPILQTRIAELVAAKSRQVIGSDPRCRPIAVLELHELNMLLATLTKNPVTVADVLDAWLNSPFGGNNFRDWLLTQDTIEPGTAEVGERWQERMRSVFRRVDHSGSETAS